MIEVQKRATLRADIACLRRSGKSVLRDIRFHASPGEVLAVLGPNGAGKSSLLRALLGLLPIEGCVRVAGSEVARMRPKERARWLAYVPQRSALASDLTVEEVVSCGCYAHPRRVLTDAQLSPGAEEALRRAHALDLSKRVFPRLSVGEQQRVLIARALATQAPVLLLDEPVAALDVREALASLELVRSLAAAGYTIVTVLHDLADARRVAHRALLLDQGRTAMVGSMSRVISPEPIRSVYGVHLVERARVGFRRTEAEAAEPSSGEMRSDLA